MTRKLLALVFVCCASVVYGVNPDPQDVYRPVLRLLSKDKNLRREAVKKLRGSDDSSLVPAIVDTLFYIPRLSRGEAVSILQKLTSEKIGNEYYDWVEYVGRRQDLNAPPGYIEFKTKLLSLIDPAYRKILYSGVTTKIRAEEIVWGGVRVDEISSIDSPTLIDADHVKLHESEKVFGITLRGESRAYPLRYLSWHEMLNDRIAGEPITISY